MASRFQYTDLQRITRWLGWLMLPPLLLTVRGFVHGLDSYHWMAGVPLDTALSALPADVRHSLNTDGMLRLSQITATMVMLNFLCFGWMFIAFRNLIVLNGQGESSAHSPMGIIKDIASGLLTATRMLRRLFQGSAHPDHAHLTLRYTIPACTLSLIVANVCKILAVVDLHAANTVRDWMAGERWMLAAYVFYVLLYLLAWRVATRLEMLQRAAWQRLQPAQA
ncbi:hypothetical protein EV700_2020 [Fluviicoccus keumensis]|uniref:Uncharacterized protein n=1 Tax=Fluviicoccus keumensis TaxID=1435465 RepID=A0A4Q7Z676_9GAMM|nr:hypothetical protein [Fluviicoccus keumensis]RZU45205.1 hypothetical protein EV700_2020 [Fluviicoccus keumensis]